MKIGNPTADRVTVRGPGAVLGRPLVEAVRLLSPLNLFRLLCGLGSLPPKDARPVLVRLRDSGDAQLQLFAQGGLNDAIEGVEQDLASLQKGARANPRCAAAHCSIAELHLFMLDHNLVEEDGRQATWDAACHAIADALGQDPDDALGLQVCSRLNLLGGDPGKAMLAAESLAKIPGHQDNARLICAEASFDAGDFERVPAELDGVTSGAYGQDAILDFWRKPKPAAYV